MDLLVFQELSSSRFCRVLVVLKSLSSLSENKDDLQTLVSLGLTSKVIGISDLIGQLSSGMLLPVGYCLGAAVVRSCPRPADL